MVPKIAKSGSSFKGAALYYLHDKKANTSERVAFTATMNLPTDDAKRAVAHMIDTAMNADDLKKANGIKVGRKLQKPVYAYSLAWHTSETPTQEEQIAAAKETIKLLGLSDRQALIVGHDDTEHPHVHVIVNRVCSETGKAAVMSNDQIKLSQWAQKYEQERGVIFCDERIKNNAERELGEYVKDKKSLSPGQHRAWQKAQTSALWGAYHAEKDDRKKSRRQQYEALERQRDNRIAQRKAEIKSHYRSQWADVFKKQRRDIDRFNNSLIRRISYAFKQPKLKRSMALTQAFFSGDTDLRIQFEKEQAQAQDRIDLGKRHQKDVGDAMREIRKAWEVDREALMTIHRTESKNRLEEYQKASQGIMRGDDVKLPANIEKPPKEHDKALTDAVNLQVEEKNKRNRLVADIRAKDDEKDFNRASKPQKKRRSFSERMKEVTPAEEIEKAQRAVRKRAKRERARGRDGGREYTPD